MTFQCHSFTWWTYYQVSSLLDLTTHPADPCEILNFGGSNSHVHNSVLFKVSNNW